MLVELVEDSLIDGVLSSREFLSTNILHLIGTGIVLVVGADKRELMVPTGMHEEVLYNLIFDTNVQEGNGMEVIERYGEIKVWTALWYVSHILHVTILNVLTVANHASMLPWSLVSGWRILNKVL
jgi:hypothetical protein